MVYVHLDSGIGNNRTFKTRLIREFGKSADADDAFGVTLGFSNGERQEIPMQYDEFLEIFQEAQRREACGEPSILNLIADNWRAVYGAVRRANSFEAVFSKPEIRIY
jgi:hypothetical protein